ncbi:hypothetical protein E5288_WYG014893 [Bos mutus]|uniref:Receptor-interacting serine/threonine-protein kinase 1 n=1 Tax=Bos mutus TaxID=72004 RepID=A0A6B0S362_9CETA|nr:hypothetical protein [Bos mutus]
MMHRLRHRRVVKLLGVIMEEGSYSLVMEYMEQGDLMRVLKAQVSIPLSVKGRIIMETIEGMRYLHGEGVIHKDLKPENILVDSDFHIKIADLGVASFKTWSKLTKEEHNEQRKAGGSAGKSGGTLHYMAPEHLNDVNSRPSEKSDVFSFAIVLWAIFANKEPYENAICEQQLILCIKSGNRPDVEDIIEFCPREVIDIMRQCWEVNPDNRPTFADESSKYTIHSSSGIQIGDSNYMEIGGMSSSVLDSTYMNLKEEPASKYQAIFDNTTSLTDKHLDPVRENLGRHWKNCARKLGFSESQIDEIDHDYERDGLKEKVYQMLQKWLMRAGSKGATVGKLACALYLCSRIDLVNCLIRISQS